MLRIFGSVILLLVTAHRAPAPIRETSESPTPAKKTQTNTKSKSNSKSPTAAEKSATNQSAQAKTNHFARKWVGTMPEVPRGNVATELIIDPNGTTMNWQESGKHKGISRTVIVGNTIQATFQVGVTEVWSLTLLPDGTARARLQATMNDQTAIFHRVVN
jgi:hypothetical protein